MTHEQGAGDNHICLIDSADEAGSIKITGITTISNKDVEAVKNSDRLVNEYFHSKNVLDGVIANRNDVINAMINAAHAYTARSYDAGAIMDDALFNVSRFIANTCSLFRSFIDHSDRSLLRGFGQDSSEYAEWKNILREEYDGNACYRLMYHMRNYIQHHDMPPLGMNFSENEEEITMNITIDMKYLAEDKALVRKLPSEMFEGDRRLPVISVLNNWDVSMQKLAVYIIHLKIKQSISAAHDILSIRSMLKIGPAGRLVITWIPHFDKKPAKLNLNMFNISEEKAKMLIENFNELNNIPDNQS